MVYYPHNLSLTNLFDPFGLLDPHRPSSSLMRWTLIPLLPHRLALLLSLPCGVSSPYQTNKIQICHPGGQMMMRAGLPVPMTSGLSPPVPNSLCPFSLSRSLLSTHLYLPSHALTKCQSFARGQMSAFNFYRLIRLVNGCSSFRPYFFPPRYSISPLPSLCAL